MILRKIIKIVATRCQILRLKYTNIDFGCGSVPDLAGGVYSAISSWSKGERMSAERERGERRKAEEGREEKGKGRNPHA